MQDKMDLYCSYNHPNTRYVTIDMQAYPNSIANGVLVYALNEASTMTEIQMESGKVRMSNQMKWLKDHKYNGRLFSDEGISFINNAFYYINTRYDVSRKAYTEYKDTHPESLRNAVRLYVKNILSDTEAFKKDVHCNAYAGKVSMIEDQHSTVGSKGQIAIDKTIEDMCEKYLSDIDMSLVYTIMKKLFFYYDN